MKNSNRMSRPSCFRNSLAALLLAGAAYGGQMQAGSFTISSQLVAASGQTEMTGSGGYRLDYSLGENSAGYSMSAGDVQHASGYYANWIGNGLAFQVLQTQIPSSGPLLNGIQLGVALETTITFTLSDQPDASTVPAAVVVTMLQDHLGNPVHSTVQARVDYTPSSVMITVSPSGAWAGNSLYDIALSSAMQNLDGNPLQNPTHVQFLTVLDPAQQNIVYSSINGGVPQASPGMAQASGQGAIALNIPPQALSNYSMILINPNPESSPQRVNPQIIRDANQTASQAGGVYAAPVAMEEINAYDTSGQLLNAFSKTASISIPFAVAANGTLLNVAAPVRTDTANLYVLDETHHLWVKIPDGQVNSSGGNVTASITHLAVFAILGSAQGDAQSVYVFPTPWRPHGPNAGTGPGQTGTEAAGMTFTNLPSQCTIKIYTLAGGLVRELSHSDLNSTMGQEKWDGFTSHGERAASGVYLWRVESGTDAKSGKLMIIE